ncbi:nucleoside hydrolase [Latilactobacillus curvatus]|uniref:nucleoside hydrolase n=1 Tax=Latilactobacillus curvatus TaxID=28038 RepID=UPI001BFFFCB5|nr:nucleoside hydrolase [Latilactobacillus curvatus]QWF36427.1 nucleoside hydrolase [Latilactobacillus curvatus]
MQTRKIIIDCDPGIDDTLALNLAIQSPAVEVVAITIVCGNVPVQIGVDNAFKCLERLGRLDIPVYVGADKPLHKPFVSAQDTHGMDGLGDSHIPRLSTIQPAQQSAADFLAATFSQPSDISIIALGPLINIATALQRNPDLGRHCARFVSMGGTYKSHGNCSPVAEFNYWSDPDAALLVFDQLDQKIEMVGLDVTREIVFTPTLLAYCQRVNPEVGDYLKAITQFYFDFHWQYEHIIGCVINDPLAVAYFIDPTLCHGFESYTTVETTGISIGQTLVDRFDFWHRPANSLILTKVDTNRFFEQFLTVVLNAQATLIKTDLPKLR